MGPEENVRIKRQPVGKQVFAKICGALGLTFWVVLPLAASTLLIWATSREPVVRVAPTWVLATQSDSETVSATGLLLSWSESPKLVAPNWSGIIQASPLNPGDTLTSGETIVIIDGISRIAWHTPTPFSSIQSLGSRGAEVAIWHDTLRSLGYDAPDGDEFTWESGVVTAEFARSIGVPIDAWEVTDFDPAWIVYLPQEHLVVDSIDFTIAAPAPDAGTLIVHTRPELVDAALIQVGAVEQLLHADAKDSVAEVLTLSEMDTLWINDTQLEVTETRDRLAVASLPLLQSAVEPEAQAVRVVAKAPADPTAVIVPSAAVFTSNEAQFCVLVGNEASATAVPVTILAQQNGTSIITPVAGRITSNDAVAVDPPVHRRTCPSR